MQPTSFPYMIIPDQVMPHIPDHWTLNQVYQPWTSIVYSRIRLGCIALIFFPPFIYATYFCLGNSRPKNSQNRKQFLEMFYFCFFLMVIVVSGQGHGKCLSIFRNHWKGFQPPSPSCKPNKCFTKTMA